MQKEIWRDVVGYEGYYQVSNLGRVKSVDRVILDKNGHEYHYKERIMKLYKNAKGYLNVSLTKNCKTKAYLVSRLVAIAFIPNTNNFPQVGHKDDSRNKENNCVENLYWTTNLENSNTQGRKARLSESHKGANNQCHKIVRIDDKRFNNVKECAKYCGVGYWTMLEWLSKNTLRQMPQEFVERGLRYETI